MHEKPHLSPWEYATLILAMGKGLATLTYTALTGWARGDECPTDYKRHVFYSVLRTVSGSTSVRQMQAIQPSTRAGYETFAKKKNFKPEIVELDDGAGGLLFGHKNAEKTLIWFHGGGYNFPAADVHYHMLDDLVELAKKNGRELRVMVLEYELAPYGMFPLQLRQAAAAVRYLLDTGLQPSQILIGGDSAGGNLATALISHLSHPHPGVPRLDLTSNIAGAVLVSPWASFTQERESWKSNGKKDALHPATVQIWSDNFIGHTPNDNWTQPAEAPSEWWRGLRVDHVAITAGGNEVLRDDIRALARNMKVHNSHVEYLEVAGEAHDVVVMDRVLGWKDEFASEQFIKQWLLARLS